jgi:hypothetical protein
MSGTDPVALDAILTAYPAKWYLVIEMHWFCPEQEAEFD